MTVDYELRPRPAPLFPRFSVAAVIKKKAPVCTGAPILTNPN
jgi:hypothetical protein